MTRRTALPSLSLAIGVGLAAGAMSGCGASYADREEALAARAAQRRERGLAVLRRMEEKERDMRRRLSYKPAALQNYLRYSEESKRKIREAFGLGSQETATWEQGSLYLQVPLYGSISIGDKTWQLPGPVPLLTGYDPTEVKDGQVVREVRITADGVRMRGKMALHVFDMDDVERLARYRLAITQELVDNVSAGKVINLWVKTPRDRTLCTFLLGLDR